MKTQLYCLTYDYNVSQKFLQNIIYKINFAKSNTHPWLFFTFFKLSQWYQTAQSVSYKYWGRDWNVLNEFRNPFLSNVSFWTSLGISENRWFCNICRENQKEVSRKKYISNVLYRSLWKMFTISFCVFPVDFDHVFVLGVAIRKCSIE